MYLGTPIAEKHMDGTWSDFIYAGGQKVARAETGDQRLHVQGTRCGGECGWQWTTTNPAVDLGGTVIRPGDRFAWSQYATAGTAAGFGLNFTDGSYAAGLPLADQDGQPTTADGVTGAWHNRVVDLSSQAGKTIDFTYFMTDGETAAGDWSVDYRDVVFLRADGTVTGLYHGESPSVWGTGGMSNLASSAVTQGSLGGLPLTRFYLADHLGSARMEFAGGGWPVWSGDFDPYGQEIQPQTTVNNYKFTGYERDGETGLDHAGARYYASSMGRFMRPDPSGLFYAKPANPQSFNLYSYVMNNPLRFVDPSGLWHCVWNSATGDQDSTPEDGGATEDQCTGGDGGGTWKADPEDPQDDVEFWLFKSVTDASFGNPWGDALFAQNGTGAQWFGAANNAVRYATAGYLGAVGVGLSGGALIGATTGFSFSGAGVTTLGLQVTSTTPGFGTTAFGTAMHAQFGDVLLEQTSTLAEDWRFAAPNAPGVDATYFGTQDLGFNAAELKPFGYSMESVGNQIGSFANQPGPTSVWWYNSNGIIGQTETIFH